MIYFLQMYYLLLNKHLDGNYPTEIFKTVHYTGNENRNLIRAKCVNSL